MQITTPTRGSLEYLKRRADVLIDLRMYVALTPLAKRQADTEAKFERLRVERCARMLRGRAA